MRKEVTNYFSAGVFVLTGVVVLLIVLYRLTGSSGSQDVYYTFYSNITDVNPGTLIRYEGYKLGHVGSIEPEQGDDGTRYKVELKIRKGWRIPDDSVAEIYSQGLLSDTVIHIEEGKKKSYLQPGSVVQGRRGIDLFAALGKIAGEFGVLSEDSIKPLLGTLRNTIMAISSDVDKNLPVILTNFNSLVSKLDNSATHLAAILTQETEEKALGIISNTDIAANSFLVFSKGLIDLQHELKLLISQFDELLSESRPDMRKALMDLRDTIEQVSYTGADILMNLQGASRNINEFSRQITDNPRRLLGTGAKRDELVYE